MITVILNEFKRQPFLLKQIEHVRNQTVPVEEILIWNNGDGFDGNTLPSGAEIANSTKNFGVWARFAYALNAQTQYICVLDDDTFPSEGFFESCLKQMEREPALLGARGLRFLNHNRYHPFISFGWDNPNENTEIVDIVGHAWFFKREWLSTFWREQPPAKVSRLMGEDIHFSYMMQKYMGIKTMVPPHPKDSQRIWGSCPEMGLKLGMSNEAISQKEDALKKFDKTLQRYTALGFKLCIDSDGMEEKALVIGPGLSRVKLLKEFTRKYPRFGTFARFIQSKLIKLNIHI